MRLASAIFKERESSKKGESFNGHVWTHAIPRSKERIPTSSKCYSDTFTFTFFNFYEKARVQKDHHWAKTQLFRTLFLLLRKIETIQVAFWTRGNALFRTRYRMFSYVSVKTLTVFGTFTFFKNSTGWLLFFCYAVARCVVWLCYKHMYTCNTVGYPVPVIFLEPGTAGFSTKLTNTKN